MYGIGVDSGNGTVGCESGRLRVEYDQRSEPIFEEVRAAFRTLETETGDRCWVPRTPITVHPGGGARVSAVDRHGLVDHRGQVHRNPGLFIADGSVLPAEVGGPPGPRNSGVGASRRGRNRGGRLAQAAGSRIPTMRARCDRATRIRQPKSRPAS
jgi:hypothetical protein